MLLRISLRATERKSALALKFFSTLHGFIPLKIDANPALQGLLLRRLGNGHQHTDCAFFVYGKVGAARGCPRARA